MTNDPGLKPLNVSLVQADLHWHDPSANRGKLAKMMAPLEGESDLFVLPEMFTSGFTVMPESLSQADNTIDWMLDQARSLKAAIVGSLACEVEAVKTGPAGAEQPGYVNRLFFVTPRGDVTSYDKVHLFRMGDEHKRYRAGAQRCVVEYSGWRLLLTVCYDLRFPVFCRNRSDYDVMLCVANWPGSRRHHWRTLLQARAIENQAYVVGVNRVGVDGNGLSYTGDSLAVDAKGNILLDGSDSAEWAKTAVLCYTELQAYRQKFPAWQDADAFTLDTMESIEEK